MLGITPNVMEDKWHTLAILPQDYSKDYVAIVTLFDGELPEALITLGSERGWLATVNDQVKRGTCIGVRIHPATRRVVWITMDEALAGIKGP
jgi:hypothetical protein